MNKKEKTTIPGEKKNGLEKGTPINKGKIIIQAKKIKEDREEGVQRGKSRKFLGGGRQGKIKKSVSRGGNTDKKKELRPHGQGEGGDGD